MKKAVLSLFIMMLVITSTISTVCVVADTPDVWVIGANHTLDPDCFNSYDDDLDATLNGASWEYNAQMAGQIYEIAICVGNFKDNRTFFENSQLALNDQIIDITPTVSIKEGETGNGRDYFILRFFDPDGFYYHSGNILKISVMCTSTLTEGWLCRHSSHADYDEDGDKGFNVCRYEEGSFPYTSKTRFVSGKDPAYAIYWFGIDLEADAGGPYTGRVDQNLQFDSTITGGVPPYEFKWDFNDDGVIDSTEEDPLYTYEEEGTFTATLTVTDNAGEVASDTSEVSIGPPNEPPSKPVVDGPTSGKKGDTFTFTAISEDPEEEDILYVFLLYKQMSIGQDKYIEAEIYRIQQHPEDEDELYYDLRDNSSNYIYCPSGEKAEVNFIIDGIGSTGEYHIRCLAVTRHNADVDQSVWMSSHEYHHFKVGRSSSKSINRHQNSLILKFLENFPALLQLLQRLPAFQ